MRPSWIQFTNADGTVQPGLCFFDLQDDGTIVRITDFWPDLILSYPQPERISSNGTDSSP